MNIFVIAQIPIGIVLPLFFIIFSLGRFKFPVFLTYEARALKTRASKRFGFYSYIEMTDWHHALIGAAGIVSVLVLSLITYMLPLNGVEFLAQLAAYYAFCNMLPISKLDGTQILFGSRIMYVTLAIITIIFTIYSVIISLGLI